MFRFKPSCTYQREQRCTVAAGASVRAQAPAGGASPWHLNMAVAPVGPESDLRRPRSCPAASTTTQQGFREPAGQRNTLQEPGYFRQELRQWEERGGCTAVPCWVSLRNSNSFKGARGVHGRKLFFTTAPTPPTPPTSWCCNHLILHHYGLSNFIKPHMILVML